MSEVKAAESANDAPEYINDPKYSRFKLQGENRFLARVHPNVEKRVGEIIIPNTRQTQDVATTGEVVAISKYFDHDKYPDIKPGALVKVVLNSWSMFTSCGEELAFGDADYVIACYDPF